MRAAPNLGADYQAAFDAIYPRLAEKYGVPLYPFFLDGVAGAAAICSSRTACIRTPKGVDRMVERILPMVEKLADRGQFKRRALRRIFAGQTFR